MVFSRLGAGVAVAGVGFGRVNSRVYTYICMQARRSICGYPQQRLSPSVADARGHRQPLLNFGGAAGVL